MHSRQSRVGTGRLAVLAVVLAAALPLAAGAGPAAAAPAGPTRAAGATAAPAGFAGGRWLTLITGDRVLVGTGTAAAPDPVLAVRRATGRERVGFQSYLDGGHRYVLPADALALVGSGRVERRLFDLTALLAFRYDDRSRPDLPLLVAYAGNAADRGARARVAGAGAAVRRDLAGVDALAVRQDKHAAPALWAALTGAPAATPLAAGSRLAAGISRVWLDGKVRATLDQSVPQIGAPAAWAAGHTGSGVTVAVLDTGVDAAHPDLADAVTASQDFSGSPSGTQDLVGHGTHVASIITGSGAASGGRYKGVAPDVRLAVGKVLDDAGFGSDSQIIAGMQWAAETEHAAVVNMSLGGFFPSDGTEPLDAAINQLTAETGTLFVVAAGNSGPSPQSISSPGAADAALTVGAVDKQDNLADFSSRGPRWVNGAIKPDITAPGVDIVAARAAGTQLGDLVGDSYVRLSGTSMATPHVAGAAAILAGEHPDWRADQLKAVLMGSAAPAPGHTVFEQGAGRVDVARADAQPVYGTPASLSEPTAQWPHADDSPVARAVTYHNGGTQPVTLDLAADVRDPSGQPAPAGMFTLDHPRLTVPAGGEASATLTTDTTRAGPDGIYSGVITASGGATRVRTPVAINKEVESYNVTVAITDRAGHPTPNYGLRFVDLGAPAAYLPYDPSGTVVARLPKGTYYLGVSVEEASGADAGITFAAEPSVAVTGDTRLNIDARDGVQPGTALDRPAATFQAEADFFEQASFGLTGDGFFLGSLDQFFVRPSRTVAPPGRFTFGIQQQQARPDGSGAFAASPYVYLTAWSQDGRVPAVPVRRIRDRDLVAVDTRYADTGALPGHDVWHDLAVQLRPPARFTELYTPGVPWFDDSFQFADHENFVVDASFGRLRVFQPGRGQRETWNRAVLGPAFPELAGQIWAGRRGDLMHFDVPMYSDQEADHFGFSSVDSQVTTLFKDGQQVGTSSEFEPAEAEFDVPAGPGTFRLDATGSRSVSDLSTKVSASWTFQSGHVDGDPQAVPMMAVRFAPDVDARNRMPAGPITLPVSVQRQGGAQYGTLTGLTVEVSYDDGASWHRAPLLGRGDHRTALLNQPRGARYVSLRATAADSAGNRVGETIIHAYRLR